MFQLGTGKDPLYFPHAADNTVHDYGLLQWGTKFGVVLNFNEQRSVSLCEMLMGDRYHRLQPLLPHVISAFLNIILI